MKVISIIIRWLVFALFIPLWFSSQAITAALSVIGGGAIDDKLQASLEPSVYSIYKQLAFLVPEFLLLNLIVMILFIFTFDPRVFKKYYIELVQDLKRFRK